jgi:hypothetical protein
MMNVIFNDHFFDKPVGGSIRFTCPMPVSLSNDQVLKTLQARPLANIIPVQSKLADNLRHLMIELKPVHLFTGILFSLR